MTATHVRTAPISVFIADDHRLVRERVISLLARAGEFEVVGEAHTPAGAVEGILRTRPDAVVLDIHLAGGSGMEVLRQVHRIQPRTRFVVLTNSPTLQYRQAYESAGAECMLDKSSEFAQLPGRLRGAAHGRPQSPANPCDQGEEDGIQADTGAG